MRGSTFALMITCAALMIGSAFAQGIVVPGDSDGDKIVSAEEMAAAEKLAQEGKLSADDLQEIKHIHEKYPINITDSANRTVTIYKPVKRMILQGTFSYEPALILKAHDRIIAVTNAAQKEFFFIPGMMDKPTIGEYNAIDFEKVIENRPDVLIISPSKVEEAETKLKPIGTTVISLRFNDINKFEAEFRNLARILDENDTADEFLNWRNDILEDIREKTADIDPKKRVYNEYTDIQWTTGSKTSGIHDIITLAGGNNIAGDLATPYYAEVDPEWVVMQNPDVIILPDYTGNLTGYSVNDETKAKEFLELVSNRTGLKEVAAVKNGRIFVLHGHVGWIGRGGGEIGVCYCAKWLYPDIFKDLDPEALHEEYFEKWLGVPYKGIWAYPQAS